MRQIKFRGKHTKTGEWIYGSLLIAQDGCCNIYDGILYHKVKANTVGQFIGLLDKNGKEIYEGDIIRHSPKSDIYYVVEWRKCELLAKQVGSSSYAGLAYWLGVTEVIGNIHDNPELLRR